MNVSRIPDNAVATVSCKQIWTSPAKKEEKYHVVAIDCGMKTTIIQSLNHRGCKVTVVSWNTTASVIRNFAPDGVFISNGPGNPLDVKPTIKTVKNLCGEFPIFGICLGHQIISLVYGAKTYKMRFGHM